MTVASSSSPSKYKLAADRFFGGAKSLAAKGGAAVRRGGAAAGGALARAGADESSLGGIFAKQTGPAVAGLALGTLDASPAGVGFLNMTRGFVKPSTAIAVVGALARGLNLDKKFLGRTATRANQAVLASMIPVKMYDLGTHIPDAVTLMLGGKKTSAQQMASGPTKTAGIAGATAIEPIPGEATAA